MARSSKTQRDIDEIMAEMDGPAAPTPAGDVLEAVAVETIIDRGGEDEPREESGPSLEDSFGAVRNLEAVMRIPVTIQVVLGSAIATVSSTIGLRFSMRRISSWRSGCGRWLMVRAAKVGRTFDRMSAAVCGCSFWR